MDRSDRPFQYGRETRRDLVGEEDNVERNGREVVKVGRVLLGSENHRQKRMLSPNLLRDL